MRNRISRSTPGTATPLALRAVRTKLAPGTVLFERRLKQRRRRLSTSRPGYSDLIGGAILASRLAVAEPRSFPPAPLPRILN
jgi:hypothetical protein